MTEGELWLNNERKRLIKRSNNTIDLFKELKDYGIKSALRKIIDDPDTDETIKNTAKYYVYWLEKADTLDDPKITKYNNYKEVE